LCAFMYHRGDTA